MNIFRSLLLLIGAIFGLLDSASALPIVSLQGLSQAGGLNANANAVFTATGPNVGVDYEESLSGRPDIASGASIRLFGVRGTERPHSAAEIPQTTQGGRFQLFDQSSNLLLEGVLGLGRLQLSSAVQNGVEFSSSDVSFSRGTLSSDYRLNAELSLTFSGMPTQVFESKTEYRNVLVGYNPGGVIGYEQRQTGTQQVLTGTRQVQTGTEQYLAGERDVIVGHTPVVTGTEQVKVGDRIVAACFGSWGCYPSDENGYLLEPGKIFLLGSTPSRSGYEYEPIYETRPKIENLPIYGKEPIYAVRPTFTTQNVFETRPIYESFAIFGPETPIYQLQAYTTQIPVGWSWDAEFVRGLITAGSCPCAPVPEPATIALVLSGAGFAVRGRRRGRIG